MKMRFHNISKTQAILILGCLATASLSVAVMAEGINLPFPSVKLEKSSRLSVPPQISPEQFETRTSAMPRLHDDRSAALEDALTDKSYVVYSAIMPSRMTLEDEGQDEDDSSTLPVFAPSAIASAN